MKNESEQNKNELKASDSKTYRLKTEEQTKNGEERRKIFTESLTETSRKHYGSTSAWISFLFHFFSLKTTEIHNIEVKGP